MGALVAVGFAAPAAVVGTAAVVDVTATLAGVAFVLNQATSHSAAPPHSPNEDDEAYPLPQFLRDARYAGTVNIGIFGPSGVGKSTLINTLRALRSGDRDAAAVGTNETTMEPTMYSYHDLTTARLWDLPGAGTERFPVQTYIRDMGLRFFDVAVLVTASRVTEVDQIILNGLLEFKVPCFVVRSKVDIDIRNEMEDHGQEEVITKRKLHEEMIRNLSGIVDVYMASKQPYEHDLPRLRNHLLAFVCVNRRILSASECPMCSLPFTIRAGGKNELVTCSICKNRLCLSCTEDLRNRVTGVVPCPFCCGCFRGPEHQRMQKSVPADVLQRVQAAEFVHATTEDDIRPAEERICVSSMSKGTVVEIHGLTGAVHLNGKHGRLNGKTQSGRLGVDLPAPDGNKAFKRENLRVISAAESAAAASSETGDIESGLQAAYY